MIPLEDQYLVLALRLELSLQFGNLPEILKSLSLLLDLWSAAECELEYDVNEDSSVVNEGSEPTVVSTKSLKAAPVVEQLRRIAAINKNHQLLNDGEEIVSLEAFSVPTL